LAYLLALKGVKVIIVASCSPLSGLAAAKSNDVIQPQSIERWQTICQSYALLFGVYIVFVNRVGVEDGITFSGASFVISPQGEKLSQAKKIEEDTLSFILDEAEITRARTEVPLLRDENLQWTLSQLNQIK
jgi:predicted amidohydrolase